MVLEWLGSEEQGSGRSRIKKSQGFDEVTLSLEDWLGVGILCGGVGSWVVVVEVALRGL